MMEPIGKVQFIIEPNPYHPVSTRCLTAKALKRCGAKNRTFNTYKEAEAYCLRLVELALANAFALKLGDINITEVQDYEDQ